MRRPAHKLVFCRTLFVTARSLDNIIRRHLMLQHNKLMSGLSRHFLITCNSNITVCICTWGQVGVRRPQRWASGECTMAGILPSVDRRLPYFLRATGRVDDNKGFSIQEKTADRRSIFGCAAEIREVEDFQQPCELTSRCAVTWLRSFYSASSPSVL